MMNLSGIGINTFIKRRSIAYALLLAPFFEPMLFGFLEEKGINPGIWGLVGSAYLLLRVAVIGGAVVQVVSSLAWRRARIGKAAIFLCINVFLWGVSSLFNHAGDLKLWVNVAQNIGFILLCTVLINRSEECFFKGCILLFGCLTIVGIISIVIHPMGYYNAETTNEAYYFLGGKNGSFPFYFSFFFSAMIYSLVWKDSKPSLLPWFFITMLGAAICRSTNSLLCLMLVLGCWILSSFPSVLVKKINPKIIALVIAVLVILMYIGNVSAPIIALLDRVGRSTTFSGRDVLWQQAFGYIGRSPLWGVGTQATFILRDLRDAGHAHSQYLHRLAVYGTIPFIFFVTSIVTLFRKGNRCKINAKAYIVELLLVVYLLHMAFDTYPYYFLILYVVIGERALERIGEQEDYGEKTEMCLRDFEGSTQGRCYEWIRYDAK